MQYLSSHLLGASAFEVQSLDFDEVETEIVDIYCSLNVTNVMQCTISESVSASCSRDVAVRCQGNTLC